MEEREQIIKLGKCLAAEARAGYIDAASGGLESFLARWRAEANGAASHPVIEDVLARLAGYTALPTEERRARVDRSLEELRALFRSVPAAKPRASSPARASKPAMRPVATLEPSAALGVVPGIGPGMVRTFARLGLRTVEDMLFHFPHRYDDYSKRQMIAELVVGDEATIIGEIVEVKSFTARTSGTNITINDGTGALQVSFFGQQWLARQLFAGQQIVVSGKVKGFNGRLQMTSPKWEPYRDDELTHAGRLVPVHPLTKGLYERNVRTLIKRVVEEAAPRVPDHLPMAVRNRAHLLPLSRAIQQIHFPDDQQQLALARYRLGF